MCGIAAQCGRPDRAAGRRMLDRLTHRGPDDVGDVLVGPAWLGHTRLSIVDVVGGRQPLAGANGDAFVVVNGEIYNHRELRAELPDVRWQTESDSEVALHLLDRHGPDGLARLRGMFALAFTGGSTGLTLARDPLGIKPLYWARVGDRVVAASELKAFDPALRRRVEAFPAGHVWTPRHGLRRFAAAVPAPLRTNAAALPADVLATDAPVRVRRAVVAAVRRRMMGDGEVGCFLSGGLDSSVVAAVAARWASERGRRLRTFAVGTPGSADLAAARSAARALGTEHHEEVCTPAQVRSAVGEVVRALEHFDPSLVRSAIPNFFLARLAARHLKVVLTGEGADELFGGYAYLDRGDFRQPGRLHDELVRSVEALGGLNLQRCDRVTMAHGLEARVPFLDREVIDVALALPASAKVPGPGRMEKDLLRRAFEGWLPASVLWRTKAQFGDGSGVASVGASAARTVSEREFAVERTVTDPPLRTREEVAYYRIWSAALAPTRPEATLSRFATA